jgi:hypothetical protein
VRRLFAVSLIFFACGSRTELDAARDATPSADAACAPITRTVSVSGTTPWTDTAIDVSAGTIVTMHASGKVRYGGMPAQITDANGGNFDGQQFFPTAVFPKAVVCSLIGRVGDQPVPKQNGFVGVDYKESMTSSGRLFLGFNDQVGQFGDNSGAFDVSVTSSCM